MSTKMDERTPDLYAAIMTWLKTGGPNYTELRFEALRDFSFTGPLDESKLDRPILTRTLVFRRVKHPVTLVDGAEYRSPSRAFTIWYDPSWESLFELRKILQEDES